MGIIAESSNYRPGEPLRGWLTEDVASIDINLIIKKADAGDALQRLIDKEPLTTEDYLIFGRLNSWCVLDWWEPLVLLIDRARIAPEIEDFLRRNAKVIKTH
ncbi:hypothetical protein GCM10027404_22360 [Arthrobacter tumbae]|uniref:hypothetical protein n=1 Tax=Arthrobacter tumbae TaxID=163874 RepID=UPI001959EBE3|nr:hypothetical protein [Arthrobacter tumbae]MBM7781809.1 hypothetical protein [Arthrobacter tumbae]